MALRGSIQQYYVFAGFDEKDDLLADLPITLRLQASSTHHPEPQHVPSTLECRSVASARVMWPSRSVTLVAAVIVWPQLDLVIYRNLFLKVPFFQTCDIGAISVIVPHIQRE